MTEGKNNVTQKGLDIVSCAERKKRPSLFETHMRAVTAFTFLDFPRIIPGKRLRTRGTKQQGEYSSSHETSCDNRTFNYRERVSDNHLQMKADY